MQYKNYVKAFPVLKKLSEMSFKARDAYSIYTLMKEVEPTLQFGIEREKALIQKYNGTMIDNGSVQFVHGDDEESVQLGTENMLKFKVELDELNEMEITETIHPIVMSYDAMGDQTITPSDIMALDGFVSFK